jgi:hypothetical protein
MGNSFVPENEKSVETGMISSINNEIKISL